MGKHRFDYLREGALFSFAFAGLVALVGLVVSISATFFVKQFSNAPIKKAQEDKALLKQLLEEFGLDVPPELNQPNETMVNSVKRT